MRAREFVTEAKTVDYEGLTLKVSKNDHELMVDALDDWGNNVLGHVTFYIGDDRELDPQDLWVNEKYQGQGIARVMYDYVKKLGYKIVRSWDQTDAGAGFWDKHRGEDVRVWESFLDEANASAVQFQTASTDNYQSSFTVTAIADGKTVGHFSFFRDPETDDVHNQAEVTDNVQGKGYGKALLLKAIEVANDHGLGFQEDSQSLSRAQSRVYDSLYDAGWIVDADGYWFLTPEGEQELARLSTMQQGVAEGLNQGIPSVLYHATYKPRLKSIKLKGLGAGGKRNWEDSKSGAIYLALDPNVAESYAESSDMVPDEWLDQIVILKISTAGLDSSKFSIDSNVQDNAGDTVEYHGVIPVSNISLYEQGVAEEQLDELSFLGSECTKDCSGHRAGYEWSKRKGLRQANSWSPSFNKGAGLAVAGK